MASAAAPYTKFLVCVSSCFTLQSATLTLRPTVFCRLSKRAPLCLPLLVESAFFYQARECATLDGGATERRSVQNQAKIMFFPLDSNCSNCSSQMDLRLLLASKQTNKQCIATRNFVCLLANIDDDDDDNSCRISLKHALN